MEELDIMTLKGLLENTAQLEVHHLLQSIPQKPDRLGNRMKVMINPEM